MYFLIKMNYLLWYFCTQTLYDDVITAEGHISNYFVLPLLFKIKTYHLYVKVDFFEMQLKCDQRNSNKPRSTEEFNESVYTLKYYMIHFSFTVDSKRNYKWITW